MVGDDDQSIYEFQGARIHNIIDFYTRYKENIRIIVLPHNYRSSQAILDKATATIQNNRQRLIYQLHELNLDKNIVASAPRFLNEDNTVHPTVKVYSNILHEEADIILQIEALQKEGVRLNDIAILYAQHKQADNIIALMERKGIPYSVKKPVNILELPLIEQVISILKYLNAETTLPFSGEAMLFEWMHAPYYGIAPTDIAFLSLYMQGNKAKDRSLGYWRLLLNNGLLLESLNLQTAPALRRLGNCIDNWLQAQKELPLPMLVEKIIYETGMIPHLLSREDHIWNIQVINTFFEYVKECHDRNPRIKIAELLGMIERMIAENIAIPVQKVVHNENGVHFYTAHGAKGNEFEYVFLIGCTKNFWESKRGNTNEYKLPDTITKTDEDADKTYKTEVARRLFYVALTRAKKHLLVSYAVADNQGKPLENSVFIDEISKHEERHNRSIGNTELMHHIQWAMTPVPEVRIALANHQWIEHVLQSFTMSVTSLSKYLHCPVAFYYENILKVPFLKNDALAFGSAVHNTLERMFLTMKRTGEFPVKEEVLNMFMASLRGESECFTPIQYERRKEQGQNVLSEYYDEYIGKWHRNVEVEFKIPRYMLDGVPVTGKIDKIELEGDNCVVIDYKSGDPDRSAKTFTAAPNEEDPLGGDYWRQMVFYKLLIENYPERNWKVNMGIFDYIERGRQTNQYKRIHIPMYEQDESVVRQQLKDAYVRIMNHDFDKGCGKGDCYWCSFTRKYELVRPGAAEMVEIDDI